MNYIYLAQSQLRTLNSLHVDIFILSTFLIACFFPSAKKTIFFIWLLSFPLAVFYGVAWRDWDITRALHPIKITFDAFALAQLGWAGAGLSIAAAVFHSHKLQTAAVWVSATAVAGHLLFILIIYLSGSNS